MADDDEPDEKNKPIFLHFSDVLAEDWAKYVSKDLRQFTILHFHNHGSASDRVYIPNPELEAAPLKLSLMEDSLRNVLAISDTNFVTFLNYDRVLVNLFEDKRQQLDLSVTSVIVPERQVTEGVLVKATSLVWTTVLEELEQKNWENVHEIPPRVWEEMIAGAFVKAGFDEVILTPRSGDHGRDVIAIRKGVGSIKILDSVKAYKPGHLVTKEEVHALMGVVAVDPNASKGILTTTSDFAPRLFEDLRLAEAVPHRIELMNGAKLREWLNDLAKKK
jgi:restriction system protein